ncbi:MAG: phage portal protein, partial [Thermoplasmata archaeon]
MGLVDWVLGKLGLVRKKSWEQLWASVMEDKVLFGGVSPRQPYRQVSNVYKAIKAIADNVPQAEIVLKNWQTGEPAEDSDLERLLENPNPFMSRSDFLQAVVGFYALYGEAFIVKDMDTVGQATGKKLPYGLYVFNPSKFEPIVEGNGDKKELKGWRFGNTSFGLQEVIHLRDFNPYDEVRGLSPLEPAGLNIDVDYAALLYNRAFFENDATPGLALATDQKLNEQIVERIRKKWEARHKGVGKAFRVAILEAGLKPVTLSYSHKDMDFIEQRRYAREEILGIWRVPKALFNITEDLNYATFMGQMKIFWLYTIAPILRKVEDALNRGLVYPYNNRIYLEFDYSNVPAFQEDFKEKVEVAKVLFEMGFTANEINERLGLGFENKPWRDEWWIPVTLLPAGSSGNDSGGSDGKSVDKSVKTDREALDDLKR